MFWCLVIWVNTLCCVYINAIPYCDRHHLPTGRAENDERSEQHNRNPTSIYICTTPHHSRKPTSHASFCSEGNWGRRFTRMMRSASAPIYPTFLLALAPYHLNTSGPSGLRASGPANRKDAHNKFNKLSANLDSIALALVRIFCATLT